MEEMTQEDFEKMIQQMQEPLDMLKTALMRKVILWFLQNAHKYYVKGSIADRDLRLISHNIKKRAKQLKVPIPDNFDEQLKPDTFVMS